MALQQIEFPAFIPEGVEGLDDEPEFEPSRHLQLEPSRQVYTLEAFGYSDEEIARCAGPVAVAGPFRVLSDEGVRADLDVAIEDIRDESRSHLQRYGS